MLSLLLGWPAWPAKQAARNHCPALAFTAAAEQTLIKMAGGVKDGPWKNLEVAVAVYKLALQRLLAAAAPRFDQVAHVGVRPPWAAGPDMPVA